MTDVSPRAFPGTIDLVRADLGGRALVCSDDFFAGMENLTTPEPAVFDPEAYTERGKLMDGWESRRRRFPGHDWCILELGVPGVIHGVDFDTSFFLGNHAPYASLEAARATSGTPTRVLREEVEWTEIVAPAALERGSSNPCPAHSEEIWTHVRLRIFPDGGVARLRVYGEARPIWAPDERVDLASAARGGLALACSDMFFSPMNNLILPEPADNMGGGWETRRSRPPGDDWIIIRLGTPGRLEEAVFDTRFFKGNYPHEIALDGLLWPDAPLPALTSSEEWTEIVAPFEPGPDAAHERFVESPGPWSHVRMRIYPDGGVSRLRVLGIPAADLQPVEGLVARLNGASNEMAARGLARCCGARRWIERMVEARPFASEAHLAGLAEWLWWRLDEADWKEAFDHHPRLGESPEQLTRRFPETAQKSVTEQAGVAASAAETLERLVEQNRAYETRFGYIFIACARGLSASDVLERIKRRLPHRPEDEIRVAAGEQAKITRLRLAELEI